MGDKLAKEPGTDEVASGQEAAPKKPDAQNGGEANEAREITELSVEVQGKCSKFHLGLTGAQRKKLGVDHGDPLEVIVDGVSNGIHTVGPSETVPAEGGKPTYKTLAGSGRHRDVNVGEQILLRKVDLSRGVELPVNIVEGDGMTISVPSWAAKALGHELKGKFNVYSEKQIRVQGNQPVEVTCHGKGSTLTMSRAVAEALGVTDGVTSKHCYFENGKLVI